MWVEDLARCLVQILDRPDLRGEIVEIAGEERIRFADLAQLIMRTVGMQRIPVPVDLRDREWRIYARNVGSPPHYVAEGGSVIDSLITEGCQIMGSVTHSVLSTNAIVEEGAVVIDSVLMPGARIGKGAVIRRAIVAENAVIGEGCVVGEEEGDIAVVGSNTSLKAGEFVAAGQQVGE